MSTSTKNVCDAMLIQSNFVLVRLNALEITLIKNQIKSNQTHMFIFSSPRARPDYEYLSVEIIIVSPEVTKAHPLCHLM